MEHKPRSIRCNPGTLPNAKPQDARARQNWGPRRRSCTSSLVKMSPKHNRTSLAARTRATSTQRARTSLARGINLLNIDVKRRLVLLSAISAADRQSYNVLHAVKRPFLADLRWPALVLEHCLWRHARRFCVCFQTPVFKSGPLLVVFGRQTRKIAGAPIAEAPRPRRRRCRRLAVGAPLSTSVSRGRCGQCAAVFSWFWQAQWQFCSVHGRRRRGAQRMASSAYTSMAAPSTSH